MILDNLLGLDVVQYYSNHSLLEQEHALDVILSHCQSFEGHR